MPIDPFKWGRRMGTLLFFAAATPLFYCLIFDHEGRDPVARTSILLGLLCAAALHIYFELQDCERGE